MKIKFALSMITLSWLVGCQTVDKRAEIAVLEFSPPTLEGGSRVEKRWEESGYLLVGTSARGKSLMASTSASSSLRPTPGEDYSPVNGTDYIDFLTSQVDDGRIRRPDGRPFTPISVDLAEYSTVFPEPHPVFFYGTKEDGSVVVCSFVTDGIIDGPDGEEDFETFEFPETFRGILRLEWPVGKFALDNLILALPEAEPDASGQRR